MLQVEELSATITSETCNGFAASPKVAEPLATNVASLKLLGFIRPQYPLFLLLEELNSALMLFRLLAATKGPKVPSLAGFRIFLA